MSKLKEMKDAIKKLHRIYYTIDPFESKEEYIKLHTALEDCFNAADITSTSTNMTSEEQFKKLDPKNPPPSLVEAWDKAKKGVTK